jgi:predicted dehydrogenase
MLPGSGMRKIKMGVLGVGEMGKRHAENLRRLVPGAELIAIADVAEARAKQVAEELEVEHAFGSLEAMLELKGLQAVLIATPDKFHAQTVIQAAKAGKDILCEKPLALTMADAYAALDAVGRTGVRLQVGFMRRYDPAHAAAMKRIEAGEIGTPLIFKSVGRDKDEPPMAAYQSGVNGMILYNSTIHDFDLARWMMRDEVAEVQTYATVATRPEVARYGDVVASSVNLQYRGGGIGNIESYVSAVYAYDVRTEILGTKGAVFVGSIEQTQAVFLSANGSAQTLADHFLTRFADAYLAEVRDFVQNVVDDRPVRVTGEDGLKALATAVAAESSIKQGRAVKVTLERSART